MKFKYNGIYLSLITPQHVKSQSSWQWCVRLKCRPAKSRQRNKKAVILIQSPAYFSPITHTLFCKEWIWHEVWIDQRWPPKGRDSIHSNIFISEKLQEFVLWHSQMENVVWIENNLPLFSLISVILEIVNGAKTGHRWEIKEEKVRRRLVAQGEGRGSYFVANT